MRTIASRLALLFGVALLAAACGGGSGADPTASESEDAPSASTSPDAGGDDGGDAPETGTSDGAAESTASDGGATTSPGSPEETSSASDAGAAEDSATAIEHLWVDESWTVEDQPDDLCAMGGPSVAQYSDQDELFICGPTAAGALACAIEQGEEVVCITDALEHRAIRFTSPTAVDPGTEWYERGMDPMPLTVTLSDGIVCDTISHDHDQHWGEMFSWYRCEDGSELLTEEDISHTFERGETWTAQRSSDGQEPVETDVAVVTFAGR